MAAQLGDLGLLSGQPADFLTRLLARKHPGVADRRDSLINDEYNPCERRYAPP